MTKMTNEDLKEMTNLYLKEFFYGIPKIRVTFDKTEYQGSECNGLFHLDRCDGYCEEDDELKDEYLYRPRYVYMGNGVGYYKNAEFSWEDVENNPTREIFINEKLCTDKRRAVATLLHELCHYYLWYAGYDYDDADKDFIDLCHKMNIPTNYDHKWDGKRWVNSFDYSQIDKYIELYEGRKCA